jgi:hypothetical protein
MILDFTADKGLSCDRSLLTSVEVRRAIGARDEEGGSANGKAGCGSPIVVRLM